MTVGERLISLWAVSVLKTVLQPSCNSSKIGSGEEGARVKKRKTLMQSDFHPLEGMLFSPDVFLTGSTELSQPQSNYDHSKR